MAQTNKRWYWLTLMAMLLVLAAYAYKRDLVGQYWSYRDSEIELDKLEQSYDSLEQEKQEKTGRVERLDDDPIEIEATVRQTKDLVREGETVYRIEKVDDGNSDE